MLADINQHKQTIQDKTKLFFENILRHVPKIFETARENFRKSIQFSENTDKMFVIQIHESTFSDNSQKIFIDSEHFR